MLILNTFFLFVQKLKNTLTQTLELKLHRIRCGTRDRARCFVAFKDEESRQKAITALKDYDWEGNILHAEVSFIYIAFLKSL